MRFGVTDPTATVCGSISRAAASYSTTTNAQTADNEEEGWTLHAGKRQRAPPSRVADAQSGRPVIMREVRGRRATEFLPRCSSFSEGESTALNRHSAKYRVSGYFQGKWKSVSVTFSIGSLTLRLHTPSSEEAHAREHDVFLFTDLNGRSTKNREDHQFGALRCRTLREVELEATEKRQPDNLLTRVDGAPINLVPTENG
jgi:hypothetical protein